MKRWTILLGIVVVVIAAFLIFRPTREALAVGVCTIAGYNGGTTTFDTGLYCPAGITGTAPIVVATASPGAYVVSCPSCASSTSLTAITPGLNVVVTTPNPLAPTVATTAAPTFTKVTTTAGQFLAAAATSAFLCPNASCGNALTQFTTGETQSPTAFTSLPGVYYAGTGNPLTFCPNHDCTNAGTVDQSGNIISVARVQGGSLKATGLTASRCVHTSTGGLLAVTSTDCLGSAVTSVAVTAPITNGGTSLAPNIGCTTCVNAPLALATANPVCSNGTYTVTTSGCNIPVVSGVGNSKVLCSDASASQTIAPCASGNWPADGTATITPGGTCANTSICGSCDLNNACGGSVGTPAGCFAIMRQQTTAQASVLAYVTRTNGTPSHTVIYWLNVTGSSLSGSDTSTFVADFRCVGA